VNLDADYALAHAWLACAFGQAMTFYPDQKGHFLDEAQVAAEHALSLDPTESETHRILAQVFMLRNDIPLALHHQEQALSLNPNDDRIACAQGEILVCAGRHREALPWIQRAMRLNPFHPPSYWYHLARVHFHLGEPAEAVRVLRNVTSPRLRDDLLLAASAAEAEDQVCLERARKALTARGGKLDIKASVERMPYELAEDREHWLRALEKARLA
jgi:adenylate cyclase